ncbi:MAG: pilus assembly protein TadG-related protein [Gemmataceae bacterium]|nr:pilus assembly protein TadG-related protein [Gemmataceae bacterium]
MRINGTALPPTRRAGKVVLLVAVMLPTVLIPILALGVDGGILMEDRRRLQAAVDAAAQTAAVQLYRDNTNHNLISVPPPVTTSARDAALDALDRHGFPSAACEVRTVSIPASSSNLRVNGKPGTTEVVVRYFQPRAFSALWGSGNLTVTARAVARVRHFSQGNGIIILEDTENQALYGRGGGSLIVHEGSVIVNSSGPRAAATDGSTTVLAAASFDVTGGYYGDRYFSTPYPASGSAVPYTGSVPVPDPLRDLPEPNSADYPVRTAPPNAGPFGGIITLEPGRYTSRLFYDGQRVLVLQPGIYYLEQGIRLQGDVQLIGTEVMIYNAGSGTNNIDLGGQGTWSLTPPTSGTYKGISIFQSRNTISQETTSILRGNGGAGVTGTMYMPTTKVRLTGNGTQTLGSQFITRTLELDGQGNFTVNFSAPRATQPPIVELME